MRDLRRHSSVSVGSESEISQVNATEAEAFHKKYYVPANIVVAIVGDFKTANTPPMLKRYFGAIPAGPRPEEMTTVEPKQVRTKLGLAYSVGGSYGVAYDHSGLFVVGVKTESESTIPATKAVLDETNKLKTQPPSPEELNSAKD